MGSVVSESGRTDKDIMAGILTVQMAFLMLMPAGV